MLGTHEGSGLVVGARLGPYELLGTIGRGGFAIVWLARLRKSRGFEKLVALKTIRPELAVDASFEKMFVDEARIAAGIEHPNVARVVDFGEDRGTLFLVMEYIPGDSLSALRREASKRGVAVPIEVAAAIVAETCAGLHAAHELRVAGEPLGVIHRDVSPQNILVSESGIPKLVDFGIAKAVDRLSADTSEGMQKGKLRYMAPEQVIPGATIDRRVDVWSAGAVLYELIEGRPIHAGPNDMARLHALVAGAPIAPLTRDDVSPELTHVLSRALAHDPEARWPTARDMREALVDALGQSGHRIASGDIEAFYATVMPGRRQQRENVVRQALAEAELRRIEPPATPGQDVTTGDAISFERWRPPPPPQRSRWGIRIALVASACAAVSGVALIVASGPKAEAPNVAAGTALVTTESVPGPAAASSEASEGAAPAPVADLVAVEAADAGLEPRTMQAAPPRRSPAAAKGPRTTRGVHVAPEPRAPSTATRARIPKREDDDEIQ